VAWHALASPAPRTSCSVKRADARRGAQLASAGSIDDVFALCFGSVEGEGALMLGDADVAGRFNVALGYTPLLDNPAHPHYYSVSLEALVVGGERLDVRPVRRPNPDPMPVTTTAARWRRWWSAASGWTCGRCAAAARAAADAGPRLPGPAPVRAGGDGLCGAAC